MTGNLGLAAPFEYTLQIARFEGCPLLRDNTFGPQRLPQYVIQVNTTRTKPRHGVRYHCPILRGKFYPWSLSLDPEYYEFKGCQCDDGTYGSPPFCDVTPISVNITREELLLQSSGNTSKAIEITDAIYGESRTSIGIDTAWRIGDIGAITISNVTSANTTNSTFTSNTTATPTSTSIPTSIPTSTPTPTTSIPTNVSNGTSATPTPTIKPTSIPTSTSTSTNISTSTNTSSSTSTSTSTSAPTPTPSSPTITIPSVSTTNNTTNVTTNTTTNTTAKTSTTLYSSIEGATVAIYITVRFDEKQFIEYGDVLDLYAGESISGPPLVSIRGSASRPFLSNYPDLVTSYPNTTYVIFDHAAIINFRSRSTSGKHFVANFTLSSTCPQGYHAVKDRTYYHATCQLIPNTPPIFHYSNTIQQLIWIVTAITIAAVIGVLIFIWRMRHTILIKASSLPFCIVTLFFAITLAAGSIFYAISPEYGAWVCHARVWVCTLSLVGVLASLFVKANRIRLIFANIHLDKHFGNGDLVLTIIVMLFLQSLILFGYTLSSLGDPHIKIGSGETQGFRVYECTSIESDSYKIWLSVEFIFMGIFLISGLYIAFGVRHVPSAFNESSHIVHALYALIMLAIIMIPLNFLVNDPSTLAVLRGIGQCALTLSLVMAVFGVKIYYVLDGRANDRSLIHEKIVSGGNISVHAGGSHAAPPSSSYASQQRRSSLSLQQKLDKSRRASTTIAMPPLHENHAINHQLKHRNGMGQQTPQNIETPTHTRTSSDVKLLPRAASISCPRYSMFPETSGIPDLIWSEWDRSLAELTDIDQARTWLQNIRKQLQGITSTSTSTSTSTTHQTSQETTQQQQESGQHTPRFPVHAAAVSSPFPPASTSSSSSVNASGRSSPRHVSTTTPSSPNQQARHVHVHVGMPHGQPSSSHKHKHKHKHKHQHLPTISTSAPASMYCDPIHEETARASSHAHAHVETETVDDQDLQQVDANENEISQNSPSVKVQFHGTDAE